MWNDLNWLETLLNLSSLLAFKELAAIENRISRIFSLLHLHFWSFGRQSTFICSHWSKIGEVGPGSQNRIVIAFIYKDLVLHAWVQSGFNDADQHPVSIKSTVNIVSIDQPQDRFRDLSKKEKNLSDLLNLIWGWDKNDTFYREKWENLRHKG